MSTPPHDPWSDVAPHETGEPAPAPQAYDAWGPVDYPPPVPPGRDGMAVSALVFGIVPIFGGLLGIVFGLIARGRTKRTGQKGRTMATWGVVLGALWLVVVAGVLVTAALQEPDRESDGTLKTSGTVASSALRLHDCVSELPEGEVETVDVVPCSQPHLGEVFATYDIPGGTYPGETDAQRLAEGHCSKTLPVYVGVRPGTDDGYDLFYLYPLSSTWLRGDRSVTCILSDPSGAQLSGSAEKQGPLDKPVGG